MTGQSGAPGSDGSSGTAANPCLPGVISVGHSPMQRLTEGDTAPYLNDEWLDDIALDTTRIGCL